MKRLLFSLMGLLLLTCQQSYSQRLTKDLQKYAEAISSEFDVISDERKANLEEIADYISAALEENGSAKILIICTHNSRRSHIAQLWVQTAAVYYGINNINAFSGGLEATQFHPNAINALEKAGFKITTTQRNDNPVYSVYNGVNNTIAYSKRYDDLQNPKKGFGAIMVCSDADNSCPLVRGADARFALPFKDPRYYDSTPSESQKYDETVEQIAREMFFIVESVKNRNILVSEKQK